LSPTDLDADLSGGARFLLLSGITPALSASCRDAVFAAAEMAQAAGVTVVLDPNIRLKLWSPDEARVCLRELLSHVDIVLPGSEEAALLTGIDDPVGAARDLLALGPRQVVVKLGRDGAMAVDAEGVLTAPGVPIPRVVDPVGAGDAFAAGFLAGLLREMPLPDTLALANRCGALSMLVPGDQEGLPRWQEVAGPLGSADVRR
jgi:2-dehydro-3-deoxygluconokinase